MQTQNPHRHAKHKKTYSVSCSYLQLTICKIPACVAPCKFTDCHRTMHEHPVIAQASYLRFKMQHALSQNRLTFVPIWTLRVCWYYSLLVNQPRVSNQNFHWHAKHKKTYSGSCSYLRLTMRKIPACKCTDCHMTMHKHPVIAQASYLSFEMQHAPLQNRFTFVPIWTLRVCWYCPLLVNQPRVSNQNFHWHAKHKKTYSGSCSYLQLTMCKIPACKFTDCHMTMHKHPVIAQASYLSFEMQRAPLQNRFTFVPIWTLRICWYYSLLVNQPRVSNQNTHEHAKHKTIHSGLCSYLQLTIRKIPACVAPCKFTDCHMTMHEHAVIAQASNLSLEMQHAPC